MPTKAVKTRDRFFDAINETYDALLAGIEATEERGHRVSRALLTEARKGEVELSKLARGWAESPGSVDENLEAMIEAQGRAQQRVLELTRDTIKGAGAYRGELQETLRRVVRANRSATDAMLEVARTATSRAARQADRLPRLRVARPRPVRPSRIAVVEGDGAHKQAG